MSDWRIEHGDCRELLASVPDGSVQCCLTSPPYFGLRDYGTIGQIGLESTPDAYVAQMVVLFREVRRMLADGGTLWLNLGDSYANDTKWGGSSGGKHVQALHGDTGIGRRRRQTGLKTKDLIGIPWAVAFALRDDGWYLRSDIIWSKPNPMPESVTDRPTKAHEYVFLLTKSAKYYYDADAIAEPVSMAMVEQVEQGYDGLGLKDYEGADVQNPSSVKARIIAGARKRQAAYDFKRTTKEANVPGQTVKQHREDRVPTFQTLTRNKRSVWTITPQPYAGAHFATMPEELAQTCIVAGSRRGDLVLDPFSGAGTTGLVACRLGRRFLGFDLNADYCELARRRIEDSAPLFLRETPA